MHKILTILIACVLLTGCFTNQLQTRKETAYGKTFKCSYSDEQPYTGKVVYRAVSDYYWVMEWNLWFRITSSSTTNRRNTA